MGAGLTQEALAARAGTSQATISAYESGAKQPSVATLARLLEAAGAQLAVEPTADDAAGARSPSRAQLARAGRVLVEVLGLAEALPARREPALRFPRLAAPPGRAG
jgi:transcriptional regulator with XRE-family HTH domain